MGKSKSGLSVSSKAIDPALNALFSQSAGAVKTPAKSRYVELLPQRTKPEPKEEEAEDDEDDSENEELEGSDDNGDASSGEEESEVEDTGDASSMDDEAEAAEVLEKAASRGTSQDEGRKRKRRQRDDDEDLEANYLERLTTEKEPTGKRRKGDSTEKGAASAAPKKDGEDNIAEKEEDDESGDDVPVHESLVHESIAANPAVSELEKANRTVFLSNVSAEAITSRKAKKMLLDHLASVLDKKADPPQKVQSIRFRSTAFETAGIPKRAAYIKKEVLEATTKSTNAYAVYTTTAAARLAVAQLNGTVVLERHLRVDSVAHPAAVDHRRCVFVGNLGFVDDETVYNTKVNEEGKEVTEKRKRTKAPMDVEEGLWRVFGKEGGKVESVRVVRDAATRVGKGFAYVQFYDGNAVESAILLNGKKFPPMLPRELRVTRCKAPHKTARAMEARSGGGSGNGNAMAFDRRKSGKFERKPRPQKGRGPATGANQTGGGGYVPKPTAESQTLAGRASKLLGRFGAAKFVGKPHGSGSGGDGRGDKRRDRKDREMNRGGSGAGAGAGGEGGGEKSGIKGPEQFVFEGRRASAKDGKPKDLKFKTKGKGKDKPHKSRRGNNLKFGK
ncbi:hypothetical protein C8A00DRAFT_33996 [Chaetomidium leptoderma]|uniref:Nucleolar protein 12 n=1 Tax=Chaetomidium leptoderma TaxID=669021 RepID=A0AAN6VN63_9PEZI|nr:hypothetical protein C8A00DRAFT_33996 [Chaetomidium leptoderma]